MDKAVAYMAIGLWCIAGIMAGWGLLYIIIQIIKNNKQ